MTPSKKTFSLPKYIADRLDEISEHTGYSQSNLVLQALAPYVRRFEQTGTLEWWLEKTGRSGDTSKCPHNYKPPKIDWKVDLESLM